MRAIPLPSSRAAEVLIDLPADHTQKPLIAAKLHPSTWLCCHNIFGHKTAPFLRLIRAAKPRWLFPDVLAQPALDIDDIIALGVYKLWPDSGGQLLPAGLAPRLDQQGILLWRGWRS